MINFMGQIPSW